MLFNSIEYLCFLVVVATLYFALPYRFRWITLLASSCYFYMSWRASYIVLMLAAAAIDYVAAIAIENSSRHRVRKAILGAAMAGNLSILLVFKYWSLFTDTVNYLAKLGNGELLLPTIDVVLPVGISFYTFQAMSYAIDVYRGEMRAERNFAKLFLYVSFFPQLVAGPIERADRLLPQLFTRHTFSYQRLRNAVPWILWGLFKKTVIADRLADYVDAVFENVPEHNGVTMWLAAYAFAFQIYCDFSGYSDIAIGSAQIFGIDLMRNFRSPYFSRDIQEFWHRWHVSLSTWLRDYLYIPLGGSRRGEGRTYVNLLTTMLLGGLWHGAGWNFVVWGFVHGIALVAFRVSAPIRSTMNEKLPIPRSWGWAIQTVATFHFVCLTWVFFRADSLSSAATILGRMFTAPGRPFLEPLLLSQASLGVATLLIVEMWQARERPIPKAIQRWPQLSFGLACYALIFAMILLGADGRQFIYFQF